MSYPVGDGGREDETIARVAAHWDAPVHWTGVEGVPLVGDPGGGAGRDTPFAHVYEHWNRHLARRTREAGARVALDGAGGDQFFQVSPVYLADLAARGRWAELLRERRARALPRRSLAHWALLPLLPAWGPRLLGALRGGAPLRAHDERRVPAWIRDEFARRHALHAYARPPRDRRAGESRSARESRWYLTTPYGPRVLGAQAAAALAEGVELRSPLYDARVIALAATRPREERSAGGETKRLLRAAGRGLLPDAVLAPRAARTGMTSHYFRRTLCAELPGLVHLTRSTCVLADLGVVDPHALAQGAERYLHAGGAELGVALILTFQAELWLRARLDDDAWALSAPTFMRAETRALRVSA
jgi:asparagine synthetase B (glutamine-hydrolysing)